MSNILDDWPPPDLPRDRAKQSKAVEVPSRPPNAPAPSKEEQENIRAFIKEYCVPTLDERQSQFVDLLFARGFRNMKQCVRDAGYAESTPVSLVFESKALREEIKKRQQELRARSQLTEDWVVQKLMHAARAPEILAKFKKVADGGELYWDFAGATPEDLSVITSMDVDTFTVGRGETAREVKRMKVQGGNPKEALDSLGRILGMFKDKVTVDLDADLIQRLQRGRERAGLKKPEPRIIDVTPDSEPEEDYDAASED